jgi:hypothetical protein
MFFSHPETVEAFVRVLPDTPSREDRRLEIKA